MSAYDHQPRHRRRRRRLWFADDGSAEELPRAPAGEEIEMEELTAPSASPKTDAENEAAVDALLAQLQQMDEKSARTWEEIERHG